MTARVLLVSVGVGAVCWLLELVTGAGFVAFGSPGAWTWGALGFLSAMIVAAPAAWLLRRGDPAMAGVVRLAASAAVLGALYGLVESFWYTSADLLWIGLVETTLLAIADGWPLAFVLAVIAAAVALIAGALAVWVWRGFRPA